MSIIKMISYGLVKDVRPYATNYPQGFQRHNEFKIRPFVNSDKPGITIPSLYAKNVIRAPDAPYQTMYQNRYKLMKTLNYDKFKIKKQPPINRKFSQGKKQSDNMKHETSKIFGHVFGIQ